MDKEQPFSLIEHDEGLVAGPGFYRMKPSRYHADPAPEPSLSSSLAKVLAFQTPAEAKAEHPRLNGKGYNAEEMAAKVNIGSVAHELLCGIGDGIAQGEWADWRSNAAKEFKAAAIAEDRTPVLQHQMLRAVECESAVRDFCNDHPDLHWVFEQGLGETVLVWKDKDLGIWGRAMLDWWGAPQRPTWMIDLKTTEGDLDNKSLQNRIMDGGINISAYWYSRGLVQLWPQLAGRLRFTVIFAQSVPPYGVRAVEMNDTLIWLGWRNVARAAALFRKGLATGQWNSWPHDITTLGPPGWSEKQQEEHEKFDPITRENNAEITRVLSFQAPNLIGESVDG